MIPQLKGSDSHKASDPKRGQNTLFCVTWERKTKIAWRPKGEMKKHYSFTSCSLIFCSSLDPKARDENATEPDVRVRIRSGIVQIRSENARVHAVVPVATTENRAGGNTTKPKCQ